MKEFKGREQQVLEILNRIGAAPLKKDSHLFGDFKSIPIKEASIKALSQGNKEDSYPAIIFIRVVLAANRKYNVHVRPNVERIQKEYPDLKSFQDLRDLINKMSRDEFYKFWGHKNPRKFQVLTDLLKAVDVLRKKSKIEDDFQLMHTWAANVNLKKIKEDIIFQIKNVALATVQHLRMDLGIDTVKPDQRVIEVLKREFGFKRVGQKKAIEYVEALSEISGIKTRTVDMILVNYGSGYYDNRTYNSKAEIQLKIAKRLVALNVDKNIIAQATELSLNVVEGL